MQVINRLRIGSKISLLTVSGLLAVFLLSLISAITINAVRINSSMYKEISLAYNLAGDAYDPGASLVSALPMAVAAEDATTPEATKENVQKLNKAHKDFEELQKHYREALPAGEIRDVLSEQAYPPAAEWYNIAEQEYEPLLLAGDHEKARALRIAKMNPLYEKHKAGNDALSAKTVDWIPALEKRADSLMWQRAMQAGAIVLVVGVLMLVLGFKIRNSIVGAVKKTVAAVDLMSRGDLRHELKVDVEDEMQEIADALNGMQGSFRNVLKTLSESVERTAAASTEMSAVAQETFERTREQSAQTQQVASAVTEMASAIAEVSSSAQKAAQSGNATQTAAEEGKKVVGETLAVIENANQSTSQAAKQILELGKNSEQIGRIVGVIEEIAGQTNLLALNASIEAARAGDQGRGFAVVAGEVRQLAERTTKATNEIAEMIRGIQSETELAVSAISQGQEDVTRGMTKTHSCMDALNAIVSLVNESEQMVQIIASATTQQRSVAEQISESVNKISEFTEHSVTMGEQTTAACSQLTELAADAEHHLQGFSV